MAIRKIPSVGRDPMRHLQKRSQRRRFAETALFVGLGFLGCLGAYALDMWYFGGVFQFKARPMFSIGLVLASGAYLTFSAEKRAKKEVSGVPMNADGTVGKVP